MNWTAPQVAEAAGISYRQLDYWIREGYLACEDPTPGTGNFRSFDNDAYAIAKWMGILVRHRLDCAAAARLAPDLHHLGRAHLGLFAITTRLPQGATA